MMKKLLALFSCLLTACALVSCGGEAAAPSVAVEPETAQMKAICELAVMDCYYHNVAKFREEDAEGFLWWQKDKHFWIEYSGVVRLGVDVSRVNVEVNDTVVTITIPQAEVLTCTVDSASLSEDSFIVEEGSAAIDAADEVAAFGAAQSRLEEAASGDTALLASAQQRAQALLEDYVTNIGKAAGKEYTVQWVYLPADGDDAAQAAQPQEEGAGGGSL